MARYLKAKKEDIGLSPDELRFRGIKKTDYVTLRIMDYSPDDLNEFQPNAISETYSFNTSKNTTWFNIDGLDDISIMKGISEGFDLNTMILSEVMNTHARPKIFEYENCLYISLKMLKYNEKEDVVSAENVVIVVKENVLLSFQEERGDVFDPIRERIRKNKTKIRTLGTDYLALTLIDIVFDNYGYILSRIGEKIELLEERLLKSQDKEILEDIYNFKGELIYLRKSIRPCREMMISLQKKEWEMLSGEINIQAKELNENINHILDSLESYRELLSDYLNIYHTTMSSKLNDIMKFLTVFSVIFIPLTFIAGIYGTNFDVLPELHYKYSYFIMWGFMVLIAIGMILYFKRKKWF